MRIAASILLLVVLVPATLAVFLVSSLKANLLTAEFIKRELASQQAYLIVEDQASQQIAKMKFENMPIDAADLQSLMKRVLPASWLQMNVESTLDRLFAWFNGPSGTTLALPIDLRGPKSELIPGLDALIQSAIPRLPACQKQQKADELCRTPGMTVEQVKDSLKQGGIDLSTVTTQLPDMIDLANPVMPEIKLGNSDTADATSNNSVEQKKPDVKEQNEPAQNTESFPDQMKKIAAQMTEAKEKYRQVLEYWNDALIAFAAIILGYLALNVKGWRRLTRWAGILALTVGLLPFVISLASKIVMEKYLLPGIRMDSSLPVAVQTAIPAAIRDVQRTMFTSILIVSAIMVAFGIAAIVCSRFIPQKKKITDKKRP